MPDTYGPIEASYKIRYSDNVQLAVQQLDSRFTDCFTMMPGVSGKMLQAVELIGTSDAMIDTAEAAPTPDIPAKHEGIFVKPRRAIWGRVIKQGDKLQAATDYTSPYVQEGAGAIIRARDNILSQALLGPRLIKNSESDVPVSVAFDTANRTIANNYKAGGAVGMTVSKWVGALTKLGLTDLDLDAQDIYCAMDMRQNEDLFGQLQVTSKDYVNRAVFQDKFVREFMGVKIKIFNRLSKSGSDRECVFWAKSGMHWGEAMPLEKHLERNPAIEYRPHAFMETWFAATRSEDEKVVRVLCTEA